jgi:hypothetical protein
MIILMGVSLLNLCLLAALLVRLRTIKRRLKRTARAVRSTRKHLKAVEARLLSRKVDYRGVGLRLFERSIWPQIESLVALYRVIDGETEFPPTRRWSISPDMLMHLVRHIRRHRPSTIVECGGGTSTIVLAHVLDSLGCGGHIFSIENHAPTIRELRDQLRRRNLERFVTLIEAPLVEKRYEGIETVFHWYDIDAGAIPQPIDMLLIDGPNGAIGRQARYPAGPELLPLLSRDGHAFLDDAERMDEAAIMRRWRVLYPDLGIRMLPAEKGCAALFFLDRKIEEYLPAEWKQAVDTDQPARVTATLTASASNTVL